MTTIVPSVDFTTFAIQATIDFVSLTIETIRQPIFARSIGSASDLVGMKKIATDQAGSGSAVVLDMLLNSLGLAGSVEVVHEQKTLADQIAGLAGKDYDGVFRMATQGARAVANARKEAKRAKC